MRLVEFFHVTEPDMLLEAAKDRYMQMLPDAAINKFYVTLEVDPRLTDPEFLMKELGVSRSRTPNWSPGDIKMVWGQEVKWAMQTLKRADRIMWYLRYVKILLMREMLDVMQKQTSFMSQGISAYELDAPERKVLIPKVRELGELHKKYEQGINSDILKLDQKNKQAGEQIANQAKSEMEARLAAFREADDQNNENPTNNTRSRATNAREAYEKAYAFMDSVNRGLQSNIDDPRTLTTPGGSMSIAEHKTNLEHFMSIPDAHMQAYEWAFTPYGVLTSMFGFWEGEWVSKQDRIIKHDDESWEGAEKIIEFEDGRAWWNLHKSACEREGKAMGHCGNSYRSNRPVEILSLREPEDEGWKVLLTFIWNTENGMVEESKAFDNQKPDPKYHPYILELLSKPFIKGMAQEGTHKPENNFQLSDLDDEVLKDLQETNPQLVGATRVEDFKETFDTNPVKQYEDGNGWYRSTKPIGTKDNNQIVYAQPFKSKSGEDYVMKKLILSYGTHGDITSLKKADGTKPDHEQKSIIVDALIMDGPGYFSPPRSYDTSVNFHINWLSKEEIMKLAKLKPSYIGAKPAEDLAANGFEKAIIKYPNGAWLASPDDDNDETDLLYVKNWTDVNGQKYLLPVLRGSITGKSLFAMSHPDLYREAFMDTAHQKPTKEEHAVIKDLLNSEHVDAIKRISDHENTFHPDDLDKAEWDEMRERKPSLGGLEYMIKKEGMSERMLNVINSELVDKLDWARSELLKMEDWDENRKAFRVNGMTPEQFIDDHIYEYSGSRRSDATETLFKRFNGEGGEELFDVYETLTPDDYEAVAILENLKKTDPDDYQKLAKTLWEEADVDEDDEDYSLEDMNDPDKLFKLINEYDLGDARVALAMAYTSGREIGAENDAYEDFKKFWEALDYQTVVDQYGDEPDQNIYFTATPDENCAWCENAKVGLWFSIAHIAGSLEQDDYEAQELMDVENYKVKGIDWPDHGWYGYDQGTAFEHFNDMVWDHVG